MHEGLQVSTYSGYDFWHPTQTLRQTHRLLSLHWLRVRERVVYKVAVLTYKALNGLAPPYLSSAFIPMLPMPSRRRLRSASTNQLLVPSYQRSPIGRRAFPIAGARVWNDFPSDVTSAPSLAVFGRRLKKNFFAAATMLPDCFLLLYKSLFTN